MSWERKLFIAFFTHQKNLNLLKSMEGSTCVKNFSYSVKFWGNRRGNWKSSLLIKRQINKALERALDPFLIYIGMLIYYSQSFTWNRFYPNYNWLWSSKTLRKLKDFISTLALWHFHKIVKWVEAIWIRIRSHQIR